MFLHEGFVIDLFGGFFFMGMNCCCPSFLDSDYNFLWTEYIEYDNDDL